MTGPVGLEVSRELIANHFLLEATENGLGLLETKSHVLDDIAASVNRRERNRQWQAARVFNQ